MMPSIHSLQSLSNVQLTVFLSFTIAGFTGAFAMGILSKYTIGISTKPFFKLSLYEVIIFSSRANSFRYTTINKANALNINNAPTVTNAITQLILLTLFPERLYSPKRKRLPDRKSVV